MNTPKLRFKEFNDEYKTYKFYDVAKLYRGSSPRPIVNFITKSENSVNWIKIGDVSPNETYINSTSEKITKEGAKKSRRVYKGEIILSNSMSFGRPYILNLDGCIHDGWFVVRDYEKLLNKKYLYHFMGSPLIQKQYKTLSAGGVVSNISSELVYSVKLSIPLKEEQFKVSNFLSLLDKKIELQSKKIEDLKLFKKGFIEFEFSNSNYSEINLKEILKERKTYSKKGLEFPHVTLSKDGIYDKTDRYNRDFLVKSDDKKYKITYLNDLCYNPANLKFGVICLNEYGSAIFSPIYVTFVIKNIANPKYIKYYVARNNFINAIRKYEQGTVYERMSVAPEDFLKFSIKLPNIEIQNKFVAKLSKLDQKIELENLKLSRYIKLKKGLMQNMFV